METLNRIIKLLDRKEVRNFKIYMQRAAEGDGRKDMYLFDAIRAAESSYDEEKIFTKLYGSGDKNAFYRLKNRLTEDLNISLFEQHYQANTHIHTLYLLGLAYLYASKSEYSLAMSHLKKAEKKALLAENYSLLNIIYYRMMRAAGELNDEDPDFYIEKRKENRALLNTFSDIDDILVAVEYKMKKSQNQGTARENVLAILRETIDKYTQDEALKNSNRLQLGLYLIVSRILLQNKDYSTLEVYLKERYEDFVERKFFTKATHRHKLQILSWIANALFLNRKYSESLDYAAMLYDEMQRYDNMLFDSYSFFYYHCQVHIYSEINPAKAIELLLELSKKENMKRKTFNGVFVYLNLASLYYSQRDYTASLKYINKLYAYPEYNTTDTRIKLRMNLGELMMRIDRGEKEITAYRIKQVIKEFDNTGKIWETKYLDLLAAIHQYGEIKKVPGYKALAGGILEMLSSEVAPGEMLFPYDQWLKEKARID